MEKLIKGTTTLALAESDPGGNMGYFLTYSYRYNDEDILGTFSYTNLEFSGPGSWEEFTCGGADYPIDQMMLAALSDQKSKQA